MAASILVIDDTYAEHYRDSIRERFPEVAVHIAPTKAEVGDEVREVDAIWGIGTQRIFSEEMVAKAARLRWIQAFTTGTDGVLALRSLKQDVVVTSMRGIHGPQVSEMAFLFMIGLARNFPRILRSQRKSQWDRFDQIMLYRKTIVIVGIGIIGSDLAARAKACGMHVIGVSRTPRELEHFDEMMRLSELERAAAKADFMVVLTPYSAETDKLINAGVLAAMKPTAFLVNLSRGGVFDEDAVLEALQTGKIAGAGLDVFAAEPLRKGHPFWQMDNVMVTPHQGGSSDFAPDLQMSTLEQNLRCFLEGRMAEMVNIVPR